MSRYPILPELRSHAIHLPFFPAMLSLSHPVLRLAQHFVPPRGVTTRKIELDACPALVFEPEGQRAGLPTLVYYHGGGFGFPPSPHHKAMACAFARDVPCRVVFPDYRLLPEYAYPAAREDGLSAYRWACTHGGAGRVAVAGDSAGATMSIYVCHDAPEHSLPAPCFQLLLYPATDARMLTPSMAEFTDTPLWNAKNNRVFWRLYTPTPTPDASPMLMDLPDPTPDAYIEVAEFDCLRDEAVAYAQRLTDAGVPVELHQIKGAMHGYDFAWHAPLVQRCMARRVAVLRRAFGLDRP